MFKRIERKLKKKIREEELGIDGDMKEVLGIHDTDSDESESESESDSDSEGEDEDEDEDEDGDEDEDESLGGSAVKKRKRSHYEDEGEEDEDEGEGEVDEANLSDLEHTSEEEDQGTNDIQITVEEALHDPLYIISIQPEVKSCILCPGKLLKNQQMVQVHTISQAHRRRLERFKELAKNADLEDNAQLVLQTALPTSTLPSSFQQTKSPDPTSENLSKRAIKRIAKFEKVKKRREKQKAGKAKSIAKKLAEKASATEPPPVASMQTQTRDRPMMKKSGKPLPAVTNSGTSEKTQKKKKSMAKKTVAPSPAATNADESMKTPRKKKLKVVQSGANHPKIDAKFKKTSKADSKQ